MATMSWPSNLRGQDRKVYGILSFSFNIDTPEVEAEAAKQEEKAKTTLLFAVWRI